MEPVQETPQETASEYYNANRKRSFLFSRVTVLTSMLVLIIALGVNIVVLSSPNNSTIKSNAYSNSNPEKNLPSLPVGCSYQQTKNGLAVACTTATPTPATTIPISISLPKLPPQCNLATSATGSAIQCTSPNTPIPTVPVTLPANCTTTPQANIAACKNNENKIVAVPLPSLPGGCSYTIQTNKDYVSCVSK